MNKLFCFMNKPSVVYEQVCGIIEQMKIDNIDTFILEHLSNHPTDIVTFASKALVKPKTTIRYRLQKFIEQGLVEQVGIRKAVRYKLNNQKNSKIVEKKFVYNVGEQDEDEIWKKNISPSLDGINSNILSIANYGFTEMFNNVIDHSNGTSAEVKVIIGTNFLEIIISDDGIGIFKKIANFFYFTDLRDAAVHLHKGKNTTDSTNHTGQGIFFTSRAFDVFTIEANQIIYHKENVKTEDWYLKSETNEKMNGTKITLVIDLNSKRILKNIFDQYSNNEDLAFDTSHFRITLSQYEGEEYVSRSQAKRLLVGSTDFRMISIDFKEIEFVGQAFVDEIFGVFGLANPTINFEVLNANDDIKFMIRKGLSDRNFPLNRIKI